MSDDPELLLLPASLLDRLDQAGARIAELERADADLTTLLRIIRREMTMTAEDGAPTLTPRLNFIAITEGEARTLRRLLDREDTDEQ